MSWINSSTERDALIATVPHIGEKFGSFYAAIWQQKYVIPATLELCRLRLAQLHRSDLEWQREEVVVDGGKREQLSSWNSSDLFSEAERACLELTEIYAMDPAAITDEQADAIKAHFGEPGLVTLLQVIGTFDGMIRMSLLWQLPLDEKKTPTEGV